MVGSVGWSMNLEVLTTGGPHSAFGVLLIVQDIIKCCTGKNGTNLVSHTVSKLIRVGDGGILMGKFSRSQENIETMDEHHFEMIHGGSLMFLYILQGGTLVTFVPDYLFKEACITDRL